MKLITTADTFLKTLPVNIKQLKEKDSASSFVALKKGTSLSISEHFFYEGEMTDKADDHLFIQLAQPLSKQISGQPSEEKSLRWFVENLHVRIESQEEKEAPTPKPTTHNGVVDYGKKIQLPGISRLVGIHEPVYHTPTPSNFTWSELTKGGTRIPVDAAITQRIVKLCQYMDGVREFLGNKPIIINSGYRDPDSNWKFNGASDSRHLYGDAVDFWVEDVDVEETFQKLKQYHKTGGLAVGKGFVHLDIRPADKLITWDY